MIILVGSYFIFLIIYDKKSSNPKINNISESKKEIIKNELKRHIEIERNNFLKSGTSWYIYNFFQMQFIISIIKVENEQDFLLFFNEDAYILTDYEKYFHE